MIGKKKLTRVNIDSLFGHPFNNIVGEPIKPYKIAIFYLVRHLFRLHFGYKAVPSPRPFNAREHSRIMALLLGIITSEREFTYMDFLRIVRIFDGRIRRGIYFPFVVSMEEIANGGHVNVQVEDALFTGRRELTELSLYETPYPRPLQFLTAKSYLGIWLKRISGQWNRSNQLQLFEFTRDMKTWVLSLAETNQDERNWLVIGPGGILPYEIDCSMRARIWIIKQMDALQICPSAAMSNEQSSYWCSMIESRHPDVFSVHLLRMLLFIQKRNQKEAVNSLKAFFDFSMLKINDNAANATQSHRLAIPSQDPLRFAPLLEGRLCRIFGDRQMALHLLSESIQKAQIVNDSICNRLANVEITAVELIGDKPVLSTSNTSRELRADEYSASRDRRTVQSNLHKGAEYVVLFEHLLLCICGLDEEVCSSMFPKDTEESLELHNQLILIAKTFSVISDMANCSLTRKSCRFMEVPLRAFTTNDRGSHARLIENAASAVVSSNRLRSGMYAEVREIVEYAVNSNVKDGDLPRHETESQAIIGVNFAYSCAAQGDYEVAQNTLTELKGRYAYDINWQAARHVRICEFVVDFEQNLVNSDIAKCEQIVLGLEAVAFEEALLRKSLLLAIKGETAESMALLKSQSFDDVMIAVRVRMQLAGVLMVEKKYEAAEKELREIEKNVVVRSYRNVYAMIIRRLASVMMAKGRPEEALQRLLPIEKDVLAYCNCVEKTLFFYSLAKNLTSVGEDASHPLAMSRLFAIKCGWKAMEKLILVEVAYLFHRKHDVEKRTTASEALVALDEMCPGHIDWVLF